MWMLVPTLALALVQIAGDNIAVVPDMAVKIGGDIYLTILVAYLIIGSVATGIAAWIGVQTGQELMTVVRKMFGCKGKRALALIILAISVPASAITGGYFAGWVLHMLTGLPQPVATPLCLALFTLLAAGYYHEVLKVSNYCALLLLPMVVLMLWQQETPVPQFHEFGEINWPLVMALVGYNAGGMRPVLIVEASAIMAKKGAPVIYLAVMAKLVEGLFTIGLAHLVLYSQAVGPLALSRVANDLFGNSGALIFNFVMLCTIINTMAPAMMVNARQFSVLSGLMLWPSLALAFLIVYLASQFSFEVLLVLMSFTGIITISFLIYIAFYLHKQKRNQQ